jgi:alpha-beta hydrolase superfamily lysophospholipase
MTHGIGEHSGRHQFMASYFSQFANVCQWDLRGHGKSSGDRAYVADFFSFTKDLMEVLKFLKNDFKINKFILFAHSMGSLITCDFMQNYAAIPGNIIDEKKFYPQLVFVSSPPVQPAGLVGALVRKIPTYWIHLLANLDKSFKIAGLLDIFYLSHDVRVFEDYLKDPLNSTKLHTKLLFQLIKRSRLVFSRPLNIKCDLHSVVGNKDTLVNYKDVVDYFKHYEQNCKITVVDEGYHELHNEVERIRNVYMKVVQESIIEKLKNLDSSVAL